MAVPFSNTKLRVPQGFQCLLEGVAREVLQMQPNDIFAFSAVYFENLLQLRESKQNRYNIKWLHSVLLLLCFS